MSGPLAGIRIIDLTAMASGPFATALLGDQGADVIKVEPPGKGDLIRHIGSTRGGVSAVFANLNRNKRSIVLDLRSAEGVQLLRRLAAGADVFVQNFRPGVAERLGIGEPVLRGEHPELIYVSVSGFGERGPDAQRKVYDSVMQAFAGFAAHQADRETGEPRFVQNVICDKSTALTTAQTITAALFARERGAGGQHVRVSMLHASLAFLWPDGMQSHTFLDAALGEDAAAPMRRATLPSIRRTKDGHVAITTISDEEFRGLCRALEQPDLNDDPRFSDPGARARNADELHAIVDPLTRTFSTADLAARLAREDVPHAPVTSLEALCEQPQVVANELIVEAEHPLMGRLRSPRPVGDFDATPSSVRRLAPGLGEHTDEVLAEIGVGPSDIERLRAEGVVA